MCHLLLEENRFPVWSATGQLVNHFSPIGLTSCDDLLGTGMLLAAGLQIKCVEWLIDDRGISSTTPRSHHRRGNIPRPRPHGDPHLVHVETSNLVGQIANFES